MKFFIGYSDVSIHFALLVLRILLGISFIVHHGYAKISNPSIWEKLGGTMSNLGINFMPQFWGFMAAFAEFFGPLLILLGIFTKPAAALLIITMFVAMLKHLTAGEPYAYALEMLIIFIFIFISGPGKYSLDKKYFG